MRRGNPARKQCERYGTTDEGKEDYDTKIVRKATNDRNDGTTDEESETMLQQLSMNEFFAWPKPPLHGVASIKRSSIQRIRQAVTGPWD